MKITLDDNVIALLEPHVTAKRTLESLTEQCIQRVGSIGPNARMIVLTESDIAALEKRLGAPALGTAKDLYQWVDRLADIRLGSISFDFTPAQYQEIMDRSQREGCTPVETVRKILYAMIPQFFAIAAVEPPIYQPPPEPVGAAGTARK